MMKIFTPSRQTRLGPAYPKLSRLSTSLKATLSPSRRGRRARRLLTIPLGLLFLHLTSSPAFALCGTCVQCVDCGGYCGIQTPIGCLPVNLGEATGFLFGIAVEILGLLALVMFAIGGYQAMTSGDDPDRIQEGKAKMTAAITGFFFLLLFVKIITIIGVNILGITPLCHVIGTTCP